MKIILVVIGILIAISINNWNEERKTRFEEQAALLNLQADFEFNLRSIEDLIALTSSEIGVGLSVLEYTGNKSEDLQGISLDSMLISLGNHQLYFSQNGFLTDLINSGKIGIIENDDLRVSLSSWDKLARNYTEKSNLHYIISPN